MTYKCFVPGCNTGYKSQKIKKKNSLFSIPKETEYLNKWKRAIPRADKELKKGSKVCALHFPKEMILDQFSIPLTIGLDKKVHTFDRDVCRLKANAVPCIFPNLPSNFPKQLKIKKSPQKKATLKKERATHSDRPKKPFQSTSIQDRLNIKKNVTNGKQERLVSKATSVEGCDQERKSSKSTTPLKKKLVKYIDSEPIHSTHTSIEDSSKNSVNKERLQKLFSIATSVEGSDQERKSSKSTTPLKKKLIKYIDTEYIHSTHTSIKEVGLEMKSCNSSKDVQSKNDLQMQTISPYEEVLIKNEFNTPMITSTDDVQTNSDFIESEPQFDYLDCGGSIFCSHYISFIEEKAKNHKLNRKLEELEKRIRSMEELNVNQNCPDIDVKEEVEEDEI